MTSSESTGTVGRRPEVILPQSEKYEQARRPWNLTAGQRPAAVVQASDVEDVQGALAYAREHDLQVVVQVTGHLAPVLPDLNKALLLKLIAGPEPVTVDSSTRTARVSGGATWNDV